MVRLSFVKTILLVAGAGGIFAFFTRAQSATPPTSKFELASIKRSPDCDSRTGIYGSPSGSSPGRLNLNCATVTGLILGAYVRFANGRTNFSLPPALLGGPSWINSERYTITAETAGRANRAVMNGPMLQTLLEDRFHLKVHRETRQVPVFALTAAKSGPKLKPFQDGTCTPLDYAQDPPPPVPGQPPFCQNRIQAKGANVRAYHMPGATVTVFAETLGLILGRPVIDKTGLMGRFDFDGEFAIDQSTPGFVLDDAPANPIEGQSVFTAVQNQLGLKLESTKGPGEVLVIDHVERPAEN